MTYTQAHDLTDHALVSWCYNSVGDIPLNYMMHTRAERKMLPYRQPARGAAARSASLGMRMNKKWLFGTQSGPYNRIGDFHGTDQHYQRLSPS